MAALIKSGDMSVPKPFKVQLGELTLLLHFCCEISSQKTC